MYWWNFQDSLAASPRTVPATTPDIKLIKCFLIKHGNHIRAEELSQTVSPEYKAIALMRGRLWFIQHYKIPIFIVIKYLWLSPNEKSPPGAMIHGDVNSAKMVLT
jgi:hypothetical protein